MRAMGHANLVHSRAKTAVTSGLVLSVLAACIGGGGPLPSADTCAPAGVGAVIEGLELAIGESGAFTPVVDDAVVTLVSGGQGGRMLPIRLRVTGAVAPSCLEQTTQITIAGNMAGFSDAPLTTYADGAARSTKALYIIVYAPSPVGGALVVQTTAGGKTVSRRLWNGQRGTVDAP